MLYTPECSFLEAVVILRFYSCTPDNRQLPHVKTQADTQLDLASAQRPSSLKMASVTPETRADVARRLASTLLTLDNAKSVSSHKRMHVSCRLHISRCADAPDLHAPDTNPNTTFQDELSHPFCSSSSCCTTHFANMSWPRIVTCGPKG